MIVCKLLCYCYAVVILYTHLCVNGALLVFDCNQNVQRSGKRWTVIVKF